MSTYQVIGIGLGCLTLGIFLSCLMYQPYLVAMVKAKDRIADESADRALLLHRAYAMLQRVHDWHLHNDPEYMASEMYQSIDRQLSELATYASIYATCTTCRQPGMCGQFGCAAQAGGKKVVFHG